MHKAPASAWQHALEGHVVLRYAVTQNSVVRVVNGEPIDAHDVMAIDSVRLEPLSLRNPSCLAGRACEFAPPRLFCGSPRAGIRRPAPTEL
jgi:hypothetical protein